MGRPLKDHRDIQRRTFIEKVIPDLKPISKSLQSRATRESVYFDA